MSDMKRCPNCDKRETDYYVNLHMDKIIADWHCDRCGANWQQEYKEVGPVLGLYVETEEE